MSDLDPPLILSNYRAVLAAIDAADPRPDRATLIAVSKTYGADHARVLLEAGHRQFGENRVKEAGEKWPALKADFPGIELHLIGPLQTNKVREAVALFDVIETLDRPSLAKALAKEMQRSGRRPTCLVEVNAGLEPQKAGVAPNDAESFVSACLHEWNLPVRGLMCIPPADQEPDPYFRLLADLGRRLTLPILSMGMSADFQAGIKAGATHVRVGSAIFGARATH